MNWWRNTALDGAWLLSEPKRKLRPRGARSAGVTRRENGMEQRGTSNRKKQKQKWKTENGSRMIMANPTLLAVLEVHPGCDVSKNYTSVAAFDVVLSHLTLYDGVWSCHPDTWKCHVDFLYLLPTGTWTQGATCLLQILACCHQRLVNKRTSLSRAKTHASRALQYRARYMWRHSNTKTLAPGSTFWLLSDPKLWKLCLSSLSIKLILGWNRKTLKVPPSQPTARASPAAFHVALVTTSSPRATHSAEPLMVFTMRILPLIAPLATMWPNSGWNFKEHTRSSCAIARSSVPRSCLKPMYVCTPCSDCRMLQSQDPTFRHSQLCFPHQPLIPHMASENVHLAIIATCRQCLSIHAPGLIGEVKLNFLNNTTPRHPLQNKAGVMR